MATKRATSTTKKAPAKKAPATAKKASVTKKAPAAKKSPAPAKAPAVAKKAPAPAKAPAPTRSAAATRKSAAPSKKAPVKKVKSPFDKAFLDAQRVSLLEERVTLSDQAESLKAEADALAFDREPGDVQFDDESGEGDSLAVERDFDLARAAQARQTIGEIDAALERITKGTYGMCEYSGDPIPKERLKAIPWARERVEYKTRSFR